MTREEIVEGLKLLEDNMVHFDELQNDKGEWIDVHELLFEAIQALSQEPCEDAISREWLMRKATERFYTTNYFNHISAMIEEAPSVTQKSGHWIKAKPWMIDNTSYKWECSECEKSERFRHNYCPNCGAKMESEDRTE